MTSAPAAWGRSCRTASSPRLRTRSAGAPTGRCSFSATCTSPATRARARARSSTRARPCRSTPTFGVDSSFGGAGGLKVATRVATQRVRVKKTTSKAYLNLSGVQVTINGTQPGLARVSVRSGKTAIASGVVAVFAERLAPGQGAADRQGARAPAPPAPAPRHGLDDAARPRGQPRGRPRQGRGRQLGGRGCGADRQRRSAPPPPARGRRTPGGGRRSRARAGWRRAGAASSAAARSRRSRSRRTEPTRPITRSSSSQSRRRSVSASSAGPAPRALADGDEPDVLARLQRNQQLLAERAAQLGRRARPRAVAGAAARRSSSPGTTTGGRTPAPSRSRS